jgi:hypothetical protein
VIDEPQIDEAVHSISIVEVKSIKTNASDSSDDDSPPLQRRTRQAATEENANGENNTNGDNNANPETNANNNA